MSSPESVRNAYNKSVPVARSVGKYVATTLRAYCDNEKMIFRDRLKDLASLSEKLESGRFSRWSDIDDLYACTIVIRTAVEELDVLDHLRTAFEEVRVRRRADVNKDPEVFRFDGLRWYGKVHSDVAQTMIPGVVDFVFEVQVLTAFEYAWTQVNHALVYKSDQIDWRRERLSAQLKATVEQLEMIIAAFDSASSAVPESPWPATTDKRRVVSRFKEWYEAGLIPETLAPESWKRFGENVYALIRSVTNQGNKEALPNAVDELLADVERELSSPDDVGPPTSGTLFQYVVAVLHREGKLGKARKFVLVPSGELKDLHGVSGIVKAFEFDLTDSEAVMSTVDTAASDKSRPEA